MSKTKSWKEKRGVGYESVKNIRAGIKDNQYWEQTDTNTAFILVQFNVTTNPYDLYSL